MVGVILLLVIIEERFLEKNLSVRWMESFFFLFCFRPQ